MEYNTLLTRIIDEGIEAAKKSYANRPDKLKGSVDGFESCRGKSPAELASALAAAGAATNAARICRADNYWEVRCFELEVEWMCNVVSAALLNQGLPTIVQPTARGMMKAASIIGVKEAS